MKIEQSKSILIYIVEIKHFNLKKKNLKAFNIDLIPQDITTFMFVT